MIKRLHYSLSLLTASTNATLTILRIEVKDASSVVSAIADLLVTISVPDDRRHTSITALQWNYNVTLKYQQLYFCVLSRSPLVTEERSSIAAS